MKFHTPDVPLPRFTSLTNKPHIDDHDQQLLLPCRQPIIVLTDCEHDNDCDANNDDHTELFGFI